MNTDNHSEYKDHMHRHAWRAKCERETSPSGRIMSGLVIVGVGAALLARQMGVDLPGWLFSWEMLVICIGIYIGAKHNFKRGGWIVPIIIGVLFLSDDLLPDLRIGQIIWPLVLIAVGLLVMFVPKRKRHRHWSEHQIVETVEGEESLDSSCVFGSIKKSVITKNFKGGDITCVFAGAEFNLMQADFTGKAVLDVTTIFGGAKLIVPSHWQIRSEMVAVMGGIEDKRPVNKDNISPDKILVLEGTAFMGGITIHSY